MRNQYTSLFAPNEDIGREDNEKNKKAKKEP
jgi:hypothetical protein